MKRDGPTNMSTLTIGVLNAEGFEHTGSPARENFLRLEVKEAGCLLYAFYASKPETGQHLIISTRLLFGSLFEVGPHHAVELKMACSTLGDFHFFRHKVDEAFWRLRADPWEGSLGPLTRIAHEEIQ